MARSRLLWELSFMRAWSMSEVRNHVAGVVVVSVVEAQLPTDSTKSSPSAPLCSTLAMGALAPFHSGHSSSTALAPGGLGSPSAFPSLCAEKSFCLVYQHCFLM